MWITHIVKTPHRRGESSFAPGRSFPVLGTTTASGEKRSGRKGHADRLHVRFAVQKGTRSTCLTQKPGNAPQVMKRCRVPSHTQRA